MFQTIKATAKSEGIPRATLYRLVKEGRVPGFYSNKVYYINVEAFREQLSKPDTSAIPA